MPVSNYHTYTCEMLLIFFFFHCDTGKRQAGGDTADNYFLRTECIAGVKDMRFQALMPDVLHWLGIQKIDRMMVKYNSIQHEIRLLNSFPFFYYA